MCRRTLTGHKDDVLHITGLRLSDPSAEPRSAIGEREPSPPPEPGLGVLFATARCLLAPVSETKLPMAYASVLILVVVGSASPISSVLSYLM